MKFEIATNPIAGSADALLSESDVAEVYGVFGDKVLSEFGTDIRTKKTFMSAKVLRQVKSFVQDYGKDDAVKIVNQAFAIQRKGRLNGRALGTSIFSQSMRWYANQLLLEGGGDDGCDGPQGFWDR